MDSVLLKLPRSLRFFSILVLALLAAYLLWRLFFSQPLIIPVKFLEANRQGAAIAEKIVNLSQESSNRIATIGQLEREGRIAEAVALATRERERNREMRDQAMILSAQLQAMTESLPDIKPEQVRLQALQAISIEVSLTNHLFDYNDYLNQLLTVLTDKFIYNIPPPFKKIDELILKINDKAKQINQLNSQFNKQIESLLVS